MGIMELTYFEEFRFGVLVGVKTTILDSTTDTLNIEYNMLASADRDVSK